mmetsp:Transcript_25086/g.78697  ORF Transcript_25086/g.78697 Transcript_25086/m.78697 type:complete len:393 (+) Transcript_25086:523-1701(+)
MGTAWPAFIWSPINVGVGFAMGLLMRGFAQPAPYMRREFVMACTFGNGVALPLVLVEVLSELDVVADKDPDALEKSQTYIFAYSVILTIMIFALGHTYLDRPPKGSKSAAALAAPSSPKNSLEEAKDTDSATKLYRMSSTASDTPLMVAEVAFDDEDKVERGTSIAPVPKAERTLAAKLYNLIVKRALKKPTVIACIIGMFVGLIGPLRRGIFDEDSPIKFLVAGLEVVGSAAVGCTTLVMAGTTGRKFWSLLEDYRASKRGATGKSAGDDDVESVPCTDTVGEIKEKPYEAISLRTVIVLLVSRLVVIPAICTAIVLIAKSLGILPDDGILLLFLLLECAVPSANMVIVLCQELNNSMAAEQLAAAYLLEYLFVPITLAFWLSNAIYWALY